MSEHDERLRALLSDAVSDVEPTEALDTLRSRTKVTDMSTRRPWLYAVGGAVVATAAVLTAVAVLSTPEPATTGGPVDEPTSVAPSPSPTEATEPTPSETPSASLSVPVYFAGDTPEGPRLYREFQIAQDEFAGVGLAVSGAPYDADYSSLWPADSRVASVDWNGDVARVDLTDVPLERPTAMTEEQARLAIQAVVYSAQAAVGEGRVPVQLTVGGNPVASILGQPTSEPLTNDSVLATLAHVSLTDPSEGLLSDGRTLKVSGVANSFEANVIVRIQRWEGTEVMDQQPLTAEGYMEDKLFPFEGEFDISAYPPGDYVVIAMEDDPAGDGMSHSDTKRFTVP